MVSSLIFQKISGEGLSSPDTLHLSFDIFELLKITVLIQCVLPEFSKTWSVPWG